jgi:nucleoside 2-deoxyribosyltransferase
VAQADLQDVRDADALLAIVTGTPPDEGVMLELGWQNWLQGSIEELSNPATALMRWINSR